MAEEINTEALTGMIAILKPLGSEERHRLVNSVMIFLGETTPPPRSTAKTGGGEGAEPSAEIDGDYPPQVLAWMRQYEVSADEIDQVFHFKGGTFSIHDVPGASKKEKTLSTYILTGVGTYLSTNKRDFSDSVAREFCETLGCYDATNHSRILKERGSEFSGDKSSGYSITRSGIKARRSAS